MKKLNITKKQYDESKYFNQKYGALKFVSESGKLYKTDKGVVIALESTDDDEKKSESPIEDLGGASDDANGEEEVTVKKGDLATALQDVIDTVKDIAAENDVVLPEEEKDDEDKPEDDGEGDEEDDLEELEFDEGSEDEVCPKCGASMKKECSGPDCVKKECGGMKEECGSGTCESTRRARRSKLVREALARRARAKKIRESIERRARAKKILESIRRRRLAKKVMESRRLRASRLRRVMESRRLRARRARMAK